MKVQNGCTLQAEKLDKVARTLKLYEVAYFSVLFSIYFFFSCEPVFFSLQPFSMTCQCMNYTV